MLKIRAKIVAEPPLSRRLRDLLHGEGDVLLVSESDPPDLLFVAAPRDDRSDWRLGETLRNAGAPEIVLLPGREPLLVRACDRSGVCYLLEPLTRSGLRSVLRSVRARLEDEEPARRIERIHAFFEELRRQPAYPERLAIRSRGARSILKVEEIDWIETAANYVRVHAAGEAHLVRSTMAALESGLDPHRFARIHRCRIVNVERIKEYQAAPNGRYVVVLRDGTRLELSRGNRRKLPVLLGPSYLPG